MSVRYHQQGALFAVHLLCGYYLAALLTAEARDEYCRRNGFEVVG